MAEKKQLNVRIPVELAEKIDNNDRPKVEIVVEALKLYFDSKKQIDNSNDDKSGSGNAIKSESSISKIDLINSNHNNNDISENSKAIQSESSISKINSIDSNYNNNNSSDNSNAIKSEGSISKINSIDSNGLERMKNEIEYLRSKIDDLLKLLHQEQVLHIQTQRMITAPEPSNVMKKWWQFWR